jgi:uncharacterized damage-inducible protein DinB
MISFFDANKMLIDDKERLTIDAEGELKSIQEWYEYNSYVRKKYLKVLQILPEGELTKDRGASFPSLLDIFTHIYFAYRLWFAERYEGKRADGRKDPKGSIKELELESAKMDTYILDFVKKIRPDDLNRWIELSDEGRVVKFNVREMLWHLVEEELQHRGELNALLWQMNIDPPVTGWSKWKKEISSLRCLGSDRVSDP